MDKVTAQIGDTVRGDEWGWHYTIAKSDGFNDSSFPGCQFRIPDFHIDINLAINVKITGRPKWNGFNYQSRCKIEFVGDGKPSTFTGGLLYHKHL